MSCTNICSLTRHLWEEFDGRKIIKQYTDDPFDFYFGKLCVCNKKSSCEHKWHYVLNKINYDSMQFSNSEKMLVMYNKKDDYVIQECNPVLVWAFILRVYDFTFPYRTIEENVEWLSHEVLNAKCDSFGVFTILRDAPEEFRCYFPKYILDEVDYKIINL